MLKSLTIKDGIIQDTEICGIPVKQAIVQPRGLPNVRTLVKMKTVIGITNHNTANEAPTAGDEAHARYLQNQENMDKQYVSVHLFVDDDSITQCIPLTEFCYHAGDGTGDGNWKTIAIEICEKGDYEKAEKNAELLNAALILTYPHFDIYKHQDWSGKYCPRRILSRPGGWENFKNNIKNMVAEAKNIKKDEVPDWAIESWNWAKQNGIADGSNPNGNVTRAMHVVMLHRMYKLLTKKEVQ